MTVDRVITTNRLNRSFGNTIAVENLSLEILRGEVFGFLGHNGAGKTTTVRLLNGVLKPSGGKVDVLGFTPAEDGPRLRRMTGVLTETPSLDERLTARENLTIYADLYGVPEANVNSRVDEYLAFFGLLERGEERVDGYSKGMKQRLALARSLLHRPEILFLDEPTSGLDPVSTRNVHDLIIDLSERQGHTVVLCTHNLEEAQKICDRVAVLERGKLLAVGTPKELAHRFVRNLTIKLEVERDDLPAAMEVLNSNPQVSDSRHVNGFIKAVIIYRNELPDLVASLVHARIRVYQVILQEPSLEDVYFALHSREEVEI